MSESGRRNRTQVDYALMVSGKGPLHTEEKLSKQKKFINATKLKKNKPVKIKLRRSLPAILTDRKNVVSRPKRTLLRSILLNRYAEHPSSVGLECIKREIKKDDSARQQCSSFPPLPLEITRDVVDFCLPQEMVEESNRRRKEAENKSLKFLFEAVRTLRKNDPSMFTEKFAALNHLFEKPLRSKPKLKVENVTDKSKSAKARKLPFTRLSRKATGNRSISSVKKIASPAPISAGSSTFAEIATESETSDNANQKCLPGGSKRSCKLQGEENSPARFNGKPKESNHSCSSSSPGSQEQNKHQILPHSEIRDVDLGAPTSVERKTHFLRSSRARVKSGYYRELNSMALVNDYRYSSKRSKKSLRLLA